MRISLPPELIPFIRAFAEAGVPAYVVGGFVRNTLLGLPPADVDLASALLPRDAAALFAAHGARIVEKAPELGTVEIHWNNVSIEHTTFRRESYAPGGTHRPDAVSLGGTLESDAFRRDFSVNALYAALDTGEIADPTGGLPDLEHRVLRATSADPDDILRSDALRVLRLVRFAGELGFAVAPRTLEAAKRNAPGLTDVSWERRQQELTKILLSDARYPGVGAPVLDTLRRLDALQTLPALLPELEAGRDTAQRPDMHRYTVLEHALHVSGETPPTLTLRLAGLLHDVAKPACFARDGNFYDHPAMGAGMAKTMLQRLRYPNAVIDGVCPLVRWHMYDMQCTAKESTLRRRFVTWGRARTRDLIVLHEADVRGTGTADGYDNVRWRTLLARMEAEHVPFDERELALNGAELMDALGLAPSPRVGELKRALLLHCATHPGDNTKARLLARAQTLS